MNEVLWMVAVAGSIDIEMRVEKINQIGEAKHSMIKFFSDRKAQKIL